MPPTATATKPTKKPTTTDDPIEQARATVAERERDLQAADALVASIQERLKAPTDAIADLEVSIGELQTARQFAIQRQADGKPAGADVKEIRGRILELQGDLDEARELRDALTQRLEEAEKQRAEGARTLAAAQYGVLKAQVRVKAAEVNEAGAAYAQLMTSLWDLVEKAYLMNPHGGITPNVFRRFAQELGMEPARFRFEGNNAVSGRRIFTMPEIHPG